MKTTMSIKVDKGVKGKATDIAKEMGLPLGTVINTFLRQFVRDKKLVISTGYYPSTYLKKVIKEARDDYKKGDIKSFDSVEELMADLRS